MSRTVSLLTVVGKDRPGIIARVTEALYRAGCNLEDMSMTILEQELAMMIIVRMEKSRRAAIEKKLKTAGAGLTFFWKDLKGAGPSKRAKSANMSCLVTAIGKDRTGIVYEISRVMARNGLNITDLNSRILGAGSSALYAMMLEVDIPKMFSLKKLSAQMKAVSQKLKIEVQIKPVERIEC